MTDLDRFETALLTELRHEVAARSPQPGWRPARPAGRRPGPRLALAGGLAAAVTSAVVAGALLLGPAPAYALDAEPNGDIVVTINSLRDADGLERALRAEGVNAEVDYEPITGDSLPVPPPDGGDSPTPGLSQRQDSGSSSGGAADPGVATSPESESGVRHARPGSDDPIAEPRTGNAAPPSDDACTMSVEHLADGQVTFRVPAAFVNSDAVLHITTMAPADTTDHGISGLSVNWEGGTC